MIADGEEVPKGGGSFMVGKPYKIAGHTYYPSEKPYSAVGLASWYGTDFHGRRTANGEIFDRQSISAAHPTLPLPSYARVTNLRNARSMIVRVNDRGPYHGGRVMDVSQRVAEALDFHRVGTARVKVDWVGRADLGGDDDAKLLATLRDDGPASVDVGSPVMTAAREEPVRTAAGDEERKIESPPEPPTRPAFDKAQAADDQAPVDPPSQSGDAAPATRSESLAAAAHARAGRPAASGIDEEPVASTRTAHSAKVTIPTPPVRPASFVRRDAPLPPIRQALN